MASDDFEIGLGRAVDPLVLAIDIGSTASRGSLYDALGRPVKPREKRPHAFVSTPDGTSVIDPDQVVDEVSQIISGLVDDAGNRPIAAVAMDTFASSLVGVDRRHRAITPCFTYNDSRCADQVAWLRDNADEQEIQDRTGCRFHASYLPARLRWLAETQHTVWRRATQWMSLGEYVYLSLLGHTAAGTSTAAWSGLLNRRSGRWDEPALELARIDPGKLSLIADPEQTLHASAGSTAHSRWRPLRGARWFAPLGDGYSSTLGVGTAPGGVVINLATSGAMRRLVDDPVGTDGLDVPTGLWSYRVNSRQSLVGGATNDVGRATSWLQRELRLPEPDELARLLAAPPGDAVPLVLPFLTGERSTGWVGSARATLHQVGFAATAVDLYRGTLEAIVWSFQRIAEQLAVVGGPVDRASVGGRVTNEAPGLLPLLADGLGIDLVPVTIKRSTLRGTALVALDVIAPDEKRADVTTGQTIRPRSDQADRLARRRAELDELYRAVVPAIPSGSRPPL